MEGESEIEGASEKLGTPVGDTDVRVGYGVSVGF